MLHIPTLQKQQRGVVLVISLMVLLVLTLLGISSLDGSSMEEKMAANSQTASSTFQKAESAIRQTFYEESKNPYDAFTNAENGATETYNDPSYELTASTTMSMPTMATKSASCSNSSDGSLQLPNIEIIGTANVGDNNSRHRQRYTISMITSGS